MRTPDPKQTFGVLAFAPWQRISPKLSVLTVPPRCDSTDNPYSSESGDHFFLMSEAGSRRTGRGTCNESQGSDGCRTLRRTKKGSVTFERP